MILQFGDNITGIAPTSGQVIQVTYRSGGGSAGRIATGQIDLSVQVTPQPPANAPAQVRLRNTGSSSGGADAETIAQAKLRAPAQYAMRTGIVTAADYANAAANFNHPVYGSVAKAIAAVHTGLNANQISIYALALGSDGRPTAPSAGLKAGLKTYYDQLNVLTDSVVIEDGLIYQVNLQMAVVISRTVDANLVKAGVEAVVENFFDVSNWSMGQPLYTSNLIEVVQEVDGVQYVNLVAPSQNILAGVSNGVAFNQLIVLGQSQIQYFYEKPDWSS
jgi:predicted phage baseplate assembly protein